MADQLENAAPGILEDVEAEARATRRGLKFSPAVELEYFTTTNPAKANHFIRFAPFGVVIYNLFLITDKIMIPDVLMLAIILQLGIVTPATLLTIRALPRHKNLVDLLSASAIMLILASTLALFVLSHAPGAMLLPFTFPAIIMTATVMVPLKFDMARAFTIVSSLGITAAVAAHPGYSAAIRLFTLQTVLTMSAYSLFVTYRLELSARSAWLLTRRETLRAEALAQRNSDLSHLSDTDGLTGIGNRRYFDATLTHLWREASAAGDMLGLLLIDIDHFKLLNDRYGHQAGDRCLLLLADILRDFTRGGRDHAARYGGEEFAVLLPGGSMQAAQTVAERMRQAAEAITVKLGDEIQTGAIRVSIGCASMIPHAPATPADLISLADAALYAAKRNGRNRVHPPSM